MSFGMVESWYRMFREILSCIIYESDYLNIGSAVRGHFEVARSMDTFICLIIVAVLFL